MAEAWEVPAALDGERVDRVLSLITGLSRSHVSELIDAGKVVLAGQPVTTQSRKVREGQRLALTVPVPDLQKPPPAPDPSVAVPVVWADDQVIVVDKPAGMVVHSGAGHPDGTMVNGLLAQFPDLAQGAAEVDRGRPGIVHRLDKGTSGLLAVARTAAAHSSLVAQLASRQMGRQYLALVWGTVDADSGLIDAPLGRSDVDPTRIRVQAGGRPARTRYEVDARYPGARPSTLLRCRLETGRTHQIRVHLQSIGHPVVGDERYRSRIVGGPSPLPPGRPFLHAAGLDFDHPETGQRLHFSSPLPEDLAGVLDGIVHGG